MAPALSSVILLATIAGGAAQSPAPTPAAVAVTCPNPASLTACGGLTELSTCCNTMATVINQGLVAGKPVLCSAKDSYAACFTTNSNGCDPATTFQAYKDALTLAGQELAGIGVDCLSPGEPTVPPASSMSSGDSGSDPVQPSAESGSESASLPYQLVLWPLLIICCCAAIGGGVFTMMKNKAPKKKGAPKAEEPPFQEAPPPMAQMQVDTNNDGRMDAVVTGVDMNKDGIPDILQGVENAQYTVQDLPQPAAPAPAAPETMPLLEPTWQGGNIFGNVPPLLPSGVPTTSSSYMNPYAGYPMTTTPAYSYSSPMMTQPTYASSVQYPGGVV